MNSVKTYPSKAKRLIFFAVAVLFSITCNFHHPVTPTLIVERHLDSSMFGVALAAMMSMNFLATPMWGKLCNYIPAKRVLLINGIGYGIGQIFFTLANNEVTLILARMFAGTFCGGVFAAMSNYVINTSENAEVRGQNLITLTTIQSVAGACGYFIGGLLGVVSVEFTLFSGAALIATCGVLFYFVCIDDTPFKVVPERKLALSDINPFMAFVSVKEFLTLPLVMIFTLLAISSIGQNSYEQCFNYFIKDQFQMSSAYNGIFKAGIALLTLVMNSTICVTLQRKTDINITFRYVLYACSALILLILIFTNQILFVGIYIVYSSVNQIRLPLIQNMIANQASPQGRNNLMGFYQSMTSLGGIFGALFAGLIYKTNVMLPFVLAFIAYGVSSILSAFYTAYYKKKMKSHH